MFIQKSGSNLECYTEADPASKVSGGDFSNIW